MSLTLPTIEPANLIAERQRIQKQWEADFETNHEAFTNDVVIGIAKNVIKEFGNALKDPFIKTITFENKFQKSFPLDITKTSVAHQIKGLISNPALQNNNDPLPPFKEWLKEFSIENSSENFYDNHSRVNKKYFNQFIAIIGELAEKELKRIFKDFKAISANSELEFEVKFYPKDAQQQSGISSMSNNCNYLYIDLWFKKAIIPQSIEEQKSSSNTINNYQVQQQKIQKIRMRNNIVTAIAIVVIALLVMKSGVIINFAQRGK